MNEYYKITSMFKKLESTHESLADVSRMYNFTPEVVGDDNGNVGDVYTVFKARKKIDKKIQIVIRVDTRDSYRTFIFDKEPYFNIIELWENDELIKKDSYVYYEY